jgi:prophage antirepressor-like protein
MSSLVSKKFQDLNVTVYGTYDKPLFKAKEIGDLLGIKNIRDTVSKLDRKCVVKNNVGITDVIIGNSQVETNAGNPNSWFYSRTYHAKCGYF